MATSNTEARSAAAPKIVVLGATGPTGRHIVSQALSRGFDVTALVRSPEKAADLKGVKLVRQKASLVLSLSNGLHQHGLHQRVQPSLGCNGNAEP